MHEERGLVKRLHGSTPCFVSDGDLVSPLFSIAFLHNKPSHDVTMFTMIFTSIRKGDSASLLSRALSMSSQDLNDLQRMDGTCIKTQKMMQPSRACLKINNRQDSANTRFRAIVLITVGEFEGLPRSLAAKKAACAAWVQISALRN
jgi:hypothetical protein